jgi:hypothetical protein
MHMTEALTSSRTAPRGEAGYPPLNTLKVVADSVWIVDGPIIRFAVAQDAVPDQK